jgi:NADPH-dependent ferric siderophore reductase
VAVQKTARVVAIEDLSPTTLVLELAPDERLDFVGGQYLIVNSGIALPDGKLAKRAYSILSPDADQARLSIAVKRIGPGSSWLHARAIGDEVPFSGPWGKFLADDARPRPTLIVATDTGITAALGLVRGQAFAPQLLRSELLWLVGDDAYFLPEAWVRARLPSGLRLRRAALPPIGHPERVDSAHAAVRELAGGDSVFLAGDGDIVYPLREHFDGCDVRFECFFNNPAKKSA